MDEQTNFLPYPLTVESDALFEPSELLEELVIIGGASFEVAWLTEQIKSLVQNHYDQIRTIRTLSDLRQLEMSSGTTVLSPTELEDSIFQHLQHEQWVALKDMVMSAGVLL